MRRGNSFCGACLSYSALTFESVDLEILFLICTCFSKFPDQVYISRLRNQKSVSVCPVRGWFVVDWKAIVFFSLIMCIFDFKPNSRGTGSVSSRCSFIVFLFLFFFNCLSAKSAKCMLFMLTTEAWYYLLVYL